MSDSMEYTLANKSVYKVDKAKLKDQLFPLQAKIETEEARKQQIESQMDGLKKIVASTNQHASTKDLVRELNEKLATEEETGIMGDRRDLKRRKNFFGENSKPLYHVPTLKDSLKDAFSTWLNYALLICALLCIVTGMIQDTQTEGKSYGWTKGVSILIALLLQITIEVYIDLTKDRKLVNLQSKIKDDYLPVLRGKEGAIQTVNVWDLQVGDMVILSEGCKVPADCIIVDQSADLEVRQPQRNNQENPEVADDSEEEESVPEVVVWKSEDKDPFLWADTYILEGQAKAVVVCVGDHSSRPKYEKKLNVRKTPLEEKMNNIYLSVLYISVIAILIIVGTGIVLQVIYFTASDESGAGTMVAKIMETLTLGLILIIVSIPEGLPMVITISLAFSVDRMLEKDNVLIKDIAAPETLGEVTEIICGKTGTLTTEDMEVKNFYAQEKEFINSRKTTLLNCHLDEKVIELIQQSIVYNATCHIEMTDDSLYQPEGNGTDVSLFKWLQGADIPVHDIIQQKYARFNDSNNTKRLCAEWPFDTKRKYATTVMMLGDNATTQRVFVKGSPDKVLPMCSKHFYAGGNGAEGDMNERDKQTVLNHVKEMGKKGLRAIAFAYKDVDQAIVSRSQADGDLTFVLASFLEDPLREKIPEIIQFVKYGKSIEQMRQDKEENGAVHPLPHVNVRLVSGDSKETAMIKAQEAGILEKPEQQQRNALNQYPIELPADAYEGKVMTAEEFRNAIGGIEEAEGDHEGEKKLYAKDMEKFRDVIDTLLVIALAEPADKQVLANSLQFTGRSVVVIGDGMNDVNAIGQADVGFAMGTGKTMARDAASMIMATDEFFSLARAIMWGRNIYTNVRRFVQFQFTCNISTLVTVFMGYCFLMESPLNAIQLLWINLLMDTLAALALATTPPFTNIMSEGPVQSSNATLVPVIWRQVYAISLWNIIVMAIVIFAGKGMYGIEYDRHNGVLSSVEDDQCVIAFNSEDEVLQQECCNQEVELDRQTCIDKYSVSNVLYMGGMGKKRHYTIIFQTFVFLQFFNFINCRMVGPKDFNVFTRFFSNWTFILILSIVALVQFLAQTPLLSWLLVTIPLSSKEFWSCVVLGSTSLLGSILIKLTPERWLEKLPAKMQMDENKAVGGTSMITKAIEASQQTAKDRKSKAKDLPVDNHDDDYHQAQEDEEHHSGSQQDNVSENNVSRGEYENSGSDNSFQANRN